MLMSVIPGWSVTGLKVQYNKLSFSLPVVHYVCDDGGEEAEQHDRRAGIHDRVQKLPRVWGERQHLLQILRQKKRGERNTGDETKVISKYSILKVISEQALVTAFPTIHRKTKMMSSPYALARVYCADEMCEWNTNECQGNVFELERCPNQHKRVTTQSSEMFFAPAFTFCISGIQLALSAGASEYNNSISCQYKKQNIKWKRNHAKRKEKWQQS